MKVRDGLSNNDRHTGVYRQTPSLKADIHPVHQRFGEVQCIFVQPDRRCADVVFADAHKAASLRLWLGDQEVHEPQGGVVKNNQVQI
jgi:hypothetical protein